MTCQEYILAGRLNTPASVHFFTRNLRKRSSIEELLQYDLTVLYFI